MARAAWRETAVTFTAGGAMGGVLTVSRSRLGGGTTPPNPCCGDQRAILFESGPPNNGVNDSDLIVTNSILDAGHPDQWQSEAVSVGGTGHVRVMLANNWIASHGVMSLTGSQVVFAGGAGWIDTTLVNN